MRFATFLLALTATAGPNCTQVGQSFNPTGHSRTYPVAASASLNGPTQQLHSPVRASDRLPRRQGASRDEMQAVTVYLPETEWPVCVYYMDERDCPFRDEGQLLRKLVDAKAQHRQVSVLFYNPEVK